MRQRPPSDVRVLALPLLAAVLTTSPAHAASTELFLSEYIEGSSNNKALEIYNGTGGAVDLAAGGYNVQMFFNGSASAGLTISLTGSVADGDVFVLAQSSANATILAQADQTSGAGWFNGDDVVVLRKGPTIIDVIGQIGLDPGTEWGSGLTSTADNTLRRKASVQAGDANGSDAFDPAVEWDGFATDSFGGLGSHSVEPGDTPPSVASTAPANGAVDVALNAGIGIVFSEAIDVTGGWFTISCTISGLHEASVGGGPTSFTLDPDTDFSPSETCSVTVLAAQVSDQDTDDPPDNMAADFAFSFTTAARPFACGEPATLIHDIQGSGSTSPLNNAPGIIVEGIVVGDYQAAGQFGGFYVQEEDGDADGDPSTSEGIFVFDTSFAVDLGERVRVRGRVFEFSNLTELTSVTDLLVCESGQSVTPTIVTLPVNDLIDWEAFEGMLVQFPQELTVTENFALARFGELALAAGGRLRSPTMVTTPGAPALALQDLNDRSRILLDDGNNQQNIDPTQYPSGGLSASNTLRSGDTIGDLIGVLDQRFGAYRLQPVGPVLISAGNPRPPAPEAVGGRTKVGAMNTLNYFSTLDLGPDICGPAMNQECRGADSAAEFTRQRDKIVSAILGLDADVVGLMEIENNATAAVQDLVDGLNDASAPGAYAFVDTGTIGPDAIKVGLIYRPARVRPLGAHAILDSSVDPRFIDTLSRPVLAQTFEESLTGERFTVAVNHLKSKGSDCNAAGDPDTGDGQGNCNLTRTLAASALDDWLATDPTGSGDPDFLIIGDLNSYAMEDPLAAIQAAGYVNLIGTFAGPGAYSFVFQGQSGYLDHALASPALAAQVTGATDWHINADEPIALDYNVEFKSPNHQTTLYDPSPYRSSDHDPLLVGLDLDQTPPTLDVSLSPNVLWPPNHKYVTVNATIGVSDNVDPNPTVTLLTVTSNEPDDAPGGGDGNTTNDILILNDFSFRLRAERSGSGTGRFYTLTYAATDDHGNVTTVSAAVSVPHNR